MIPGVLREPGGFALLAVLWVMVGVAALGVAASLAGREAVAAAYNRRNLIRAEWRAEACMERARAAIAGALDGPVGGEVEESPWTALDEAVVSSPLVSAAGCDVTVSAAGVGVDLNTADVETLRKLFVGIGITTQRSDSLTDALLDWRDPDGVPRPHGAERPWYTDWFRHPPRDGPFADVRELRRVRGFETPTGPDSLLGVEPDRISLNHAPLPVLSALPGFTAETVARMAERRLRGERLAELRVLTGEISPAARDSLMARFPELLRMTAVEPEAWIVTARARFGTPAVTAVLEVKLARAGSRAAIIRRRTWSS